MIYYLMLSALPKGNLQVVLVNFLVVGLVWSIMRFLDSERISNYIEKNNVLLWCVATCYSILYIFIVTFFKKKEEFSVLNGLLLFSVVMLLFVICQQIKIQKEKIAFRERELKFLKQANESFEHLLSAVQARQHEFDNQLEAIYSLHYVCDTYEELVERQSDYISNIVEKNQFNSLLIAKCAPAIKGFLYYKFGQAQKEGIKIDYRIAIDRMNEPELEYDLQESLGILFDNAKEAMEAEVSQRCIYVELLQENKKIIVRVENTSGYVPQSEIELMFEAGYSTKGTNRGFGLNNIRKIVNKYDGLIFVENREKEGQNWFSISLELYDS